MTILSLKVYHFPSKCLQSAIKCPLILLSPKWDITPINLYLVGHCLLSTYFSIFRFSSNSTSQSNLFAFPLFNINIKTCGEEKILFSPFASNNLLHLLQYIWLSPLNSIVFISFSKQSINVTLFLP